MIVLISHIAEVIVLGGGFLMLAVAAVWLVGEDLGADVDLMREERRDDGGAA